ncbi:unnamed protein product [Rotaria sordida]|uniref:EGF-like domain-containing protein n=1 Tax=Rotaria sordida TaxID=392033 RepID=A0A815JGK5_9BILA|nr:unnamed protein product [Rotaria sordida]
MISSSTTRTQGNCSEISNSTFLCICDDGWQGIHCESMINFCHNVTCENKGVCRSLLLNYRCECLGNNYYGHHCEFTSKKIITYKIVSTSFAYIAIIALIIVAMFIIIMNILKYCFGIDSTQEDSKRYRREKQARKRKHPVIERFVYVNAPPQISK